MDLETRRMINVLHVAIKGLGEEMINNSNRLEREFKAISREFSEQEETRDAQYKLLWEYLDGLQGRVETIDARLGAI